MSFKEIKQKKLTWAHSDSTDKETIDYLQNNYSFHPLDIEDIQTGGSQIPKLDTYKDYLFLVVQFPQWKQNEKTITRQEVYIFFGDNYVVTIEPARTSVMKNIFTRCLNTDAIRNEWMGGSSGFLVYNIIESIFHTTQPILNELGKNLSEAEEEIFQDSPDISLIKEIAMYRRDILKFRRLVDPQRYLISSLSHTHRSFLDESLSIYFDDLTDFLNKQWSILESFRDTIEGLHVTLESVTNQRTTQVISFLTYISVGLMPFTLLSSIYGMNITNLPYAHNPLVVWSLFGMLGVFTIIFIAYMRRKKWL